MVGVLAQKWMKAERAKRIKESKKDANEKLLDEMEKDLETIGKLCGKDTVSKVKDVNILKA
jgi:hypothetical protein